MGKKYVTFGDIEIEKNIFYCRNTPIFWKKTDIEKVVLV